MGEGKVTTFKNYRIFRERLSQGVDWLSLPDDAIPIGIEREETRRQDMYTETETIEIRRFIVYLQPQE